MAKKAKNADQATKLEDIPNIGPSIASNLRSIGVDTPKELLKHDPYLLYAKLCKRTGQYHDPCVLDIFLSAKHFMSKSESLKWWFFTNERKKNFNKIKDIVEKFK